MTLLICGHRCHWSWQYHRIHGNAGDTWEDRAQVVERMYRLNNEHIEEVFDRTAVDAGQLIEQSGVREGQKRMNKMLLADPALFRSGASPSSECGPIQATGGRSLHVPPDTKRRGRGAPIVEVSVLMGPVSECRSENAHSRRNVPMPGALNAAGQNGVSSPLVHKIYEPSHHSDMAFVLAAKNGVRSHHWNFGNMPPVKGLTDADVKMVTTRPETPGK